MLRPIEPEVLRETYSDNFEPVRVEKSSPKLTLTPTKFHKNLKFLRSMINYSKTQTYNPLVYPYKSALTI